MAKYQNTNNELSKKMFMEIFGNLSEESKIKLIESISKIQNATRL